MCWSTCVWLDDLYMEVVHHLLPVHVLYLLINVLYKVQPCWLKTCWHKLHKVSAPALSDKRLRWVCNLRMYSMWGREQDSHDDDNTSWFFCNKASLHLRVVKSQQSEGVTHGDKLSFGLSLSLLQHRTLFPRQRTIEEVNQAWELPTFTCQCGSKSNLKLFRFAGSVSFTHERS